MAGFQQRKLLQRSLILLWILTWAWVPLAKNLHTRLTGFGSRSPLKSIFAKEPTVEAANTTLWVHLSSDERLWIKSLWNNRNITFGISMDAQGCWDAIDRGDGEATVMDESVNWIPIEGLYGIYQVPTGLIWVLVARSDCVYHNDYCHVRRVHTLELFHLSSRSTHHLLSQRLLKEQARQVRLLRQALRHHNFYFSPAPYDMTQTLQRSIVLGNPQPECRFYWNGPSVHRLVETCRNTTVSQLLQDRHVLPICSAFVGVQSNVSPSSNDWSYDEVLISRRSRFRAGTRFTKRGADATGAVANFAETEQQCWLYNDNHTLLQVSSHVQTRGSIPLRWSSPADVKTYRPRVRIGIDPLAQARAVQSHVQQELTSYTNIDTLTKQPQLLFVNLIDKKQDQGRLGRAFDAVLQAVLDVFNTTSVQHLWFDFHAEVKHGKWGKLESLLKQVTPALEEQGYFRAIPSSNGTWAVRSTQQGVVRTNCMDCLDRTNVVQSIFGRYMLYRQLEGVRDKSKRVLPVEYAAVFRRNPMSLPWAAGEVSHRNLWADNADAISKLYAGTPALKRDFTRTGKRTRRGALDDGMNSLQRYYLNNFMDADRQEGMDLMVGYADFSTDDMFDPVSLEKARARLLSSFEESSYERIKQQRRGRITAPRELDLRWLPGDLQGHLKSHVSGVTDKTKEALESMDQRSASDAPWWAITATATDDGSSSEDEDKDEVMPPSAIANTGHVLGALVAAMQAPTTTAIAVVCMLGFANAGARLSSKKDKES